MTPRGQQYDSLLLVTKSAFDTSNLYDFWQAGEGGGCCYSL